MSTRYHTIVVDPPWPHPDSGAHSHAQRGNWEGLAEGGKSLVGAKSVVPYERMTLDQIKALPVAELADDAAHLYLWTTSGFLWQSREVVQAWGFRYSTLLTWCKAPMGLGFGGAYVNTTEFILFARRGKLAPLRRWDSTWFNFRRPYNDNGAPAHSSKPDAFLDVVEQVSPGPYAELFARRARLGWDYPIGDQALGGVAAWQV